MSTYKPTHIVLQYLALKREWRALEHGHPDEGYLLDRMSALRDFMSKEDKMYVDRLRLFKDF